MVISFSRKWLFSLLSLATGIGFSRSRNEGVLVRAARSRDRDAFEELMRNNALALRRFVSKRLPAADVDDVLQDTWLAAWERVASFDGDSKFRAWAFSICHHKVQDYWRRHHSKSAQVRESFEDGSSTYVPKEFAQVELRECLSSFWSACPSDQREVLLMYYGDGLTLKEIGEILGRNLNTVKYQFYRAHDLAAGMLPDSERLIGEGQS